MMAVMMAQQSAAAPLHAPQLARQPGRAVLHRSMQSPRRPCRALRFAWQPQRQRRVGAGTAAPPRDAPAAQPQQPNSREQPLVTDCGVAIVVGAGPAGTVTAMYLARQGFRVRVLEKRPDPAHADLAKQTFIMGIMPRGLNPLIELGVQLPHSGWLGELANNKGSCVHAVDGTVRTRPQPEGNVLAERASFAAHLLQEARRLYPAIQFDFDVDIQDIQLRSRSVTLTPRQGGSQLQTLKYDLLVGADGTASQVRDAAVAQEPKFTASRELSGVEYLVLHDLPPVPGLDSEGGNADPTAGGRSLHMFTAAPTDELRQPFMAFGAYVQKDGTYSAALQFNRGWQPSATAAEAEAALRSAVPHLPEGWRRPIARQVAGSQPRSWGSTVSCSHLSVPWAGLLLIGDAGHGVSPTMGQGCNAALESANQADKVLAAHPKDLTLALAEFDRVRKPDMQALRHIDKISGRLWGGGYMAGGNLNWPYLGTLANILVSGTLHKLFPRWWNPPAMLTAFTTTTTSYRQVLWRRNRDLALLGALFVAVVAAVAEAVKLALTLL